MVWGTTYRVIANSDPIALEDSFVGQVVVIRSRTTVHRFRTVGLGHIKCAIIRTNSTRRTLRVFGASRRNFSVTLLSVSVPNVSKLALYGRLHQEDRALNVVVLATEARRVSGVANLVRNTSSCVAGPFDPARLLTHISSLCHEIRVCTPGATTVPSSVILNRFALGLEGHALLGGSGGVRLARIRFRVVRCFFAGPSITLNEASVLGGM